MTDAVRMTPSFIRPAKLNVTTEVVCMSAYSDKVIRNANKPPNDIAAACITNELMYMTSYRCRVVIIVGPADVLVSDSGTCPVEMMASSMAACTRKKLSCAEWSWFAGWLSIKSWVPPNSMSHEQNKSVPNMYGVVDLRVRRTRSKEEEFAGRAGEASIGDPGGDPPADAAAAAADNNTCVSAHLTADMTVANMTNMNPVGWNFVSPATVNIAPPTITDMNAKCAHDALSMPNQMASSATQNDTVDLHIV